ncbi:MAG: preprotein translocase subunit SecE [Caldilineales bacterium]|nr:preprotein translocase subunit SecE [Caldilineales bacterium]
MAKVKTEAPAKISTNPIMRYVRETRAELTKVSWPTREDWIRLSGIVLIVTVVMAIILGVADAAGSWIMELLLRI